MACRWATIAAVVDPVGVKAYWSEKFRSGGGSSSNNNNSNNNNNNYSVEMCQLIWVSLSAVWFGASSARPGHTRRLWSSSTCHQTLFGTLQPGSVVVKLDFANAFNSLHRFDMLQAVKEHLPELYAYVFTAYSSPTVLFYGPHTLLSQEGPQQGDPLGPLLFCNTINPIKLETSNLVRALNAMPVTQKVQN